MFYNAEEKYLTWLSYISVSNAKITELFSIYKSYENVFGAFNKRDEKLAEIVGRDKAEEWGWLATEKILSDMLDVLKKDNTKVLTKFSKYVPRKVQEAIDAQVFHLLFYKGDLRYIDQKTASIIGTRLPDGYGTRVAKIFASKLASHGVVLVSGLAQGIDTIAHEEALKAGSGTIAVLGGGFNRIYPKQNAELAEKIAKDGLLLSEYPPTKDIMPHNFPTRNRIIAALSDANVFPQMGKKSGALHTFNFAIEYGKDVFVVPAEIERTASEGNLLAIKAYPQAFTISPDEVLDFLDRLEGNQNKIPKKESKPKKVKPQTEKKEELNEKQEAKKSFNFIKIYATLNEGEKQIVNTIGYNSLSKTEIATHSGLDAKVVNSTLTVLQVKGIVEIKDGLYCLK
ncbi:MAG: DNA-processing protein DprA [Firmicutes bacterium]|nr:DNA-processing protein DprA [Bacillota bacterium]MCL2771025.1 DNA-processing protein DprA [Bacillota bacterium]